MRTKTTRLVAFVLVLATIMMSLPTTLAISEEKLKLEEILGVYDGSYTASKVRIGLTLGIYNTKELLENHELLQNYADIANRCANGGKVGTENAFTAESIQNIISQHAEEYIALFNYYPTAGSKAEYGLYTMKVAYDAKTGKYAFTGSKWIQHDTYRFADLKNVTFQDNTLSGDVYGKSLVTYDKLGSVSVRKGAGETGYRIVMNEDAVTLGVGEMKLLECTVYNAEGKAQSALDLTFGDIPVYWSCSNDEVIELLSGKATTGLEPDKIMLKGISQGTVTVYAELGNKRIAQCQVTVTGEITPEEEEKPGFDPEDWILSNSRYDEENACFWLTEDHTQWDTGAIWYKYPCNNDFTLEMEYYTGSTNREMGGADGIVIAFYAKKDYDLPAGLLIGFDGCSGYGVELDTYFENPNDPAYNHIGLVKDSVQNHLVTAQLPEAEDELWHHIKVEVKDGICSAYVDGTPKFTQAVEKTGYGYLGVTSATGSGENRHMVRNLTVTSDTINSTKLSELSAIDYLAFSHIAYQSLVGFKGKTIYEILVETGQRDTSWKETDILTSEIFANIAGWKYFFFSEDTDSGFYAMAFENDYGEVVIAFRGSEPLTSSDIGFAEKWKDWVLADVEMGVGGNNSQVLSAIEFYDTIARIRPDSTITITGHSLGGALGNLTSAYSGSYAETFNSAPFLDIAYYYYPRYMGKAYRGIDCWNFIDHTNAGDIGIGGLDRERKPHWLHDPLDLSGHHFLNSFVYKDADGNVVMTNVRERNTVTQQTWPQDLEEDNAHVYMGTSGEDTVATKYQVVAYGGDGQDSFISFHNSANDIFVGGAGDDQLDGGYGDDTYYFFKGDGVDHIRDMFGYDKLYLLNFHESDVISAEENDEVIEVLCNGEAIVRISKGGSARTFTVITSSDEKIYLGPHLENAIFDYRAMIACPVSLEILDETTGKVVQHIDGATEAAYYTQYGNFYVYADENGEYVKIADVLNGYSIRILGDDTGTMDVSIYNTEEQTLSAGYTASNIPVSETMVAAICWDSTVASLEIDKDGDGTVDQVVGLSDSYDADVLPTTEPVGNGTADGKTGFKMPLVGYILIAVFVAAVASIIVCATLVRKKRHK